MSRRRSLGVVAVAVALLGACTGDDRGPVGTTHAGGPPVEIDAVVRAAADEVIVPGYEALVDDQGLRTLTEASTLDELPDNRVDGPAAYRMAELVALFDGIEAIVRGPADGKGPSLLDLVAARSPDTADRLDDLVPRVREALDALPDSVAEAFAATDELAEAQQAVADLDVLVSTEVASQLGVTVGFSDAGGDS